jgi:prepilin-type N-terminal cleavage/methylation domain-containing protein
MLHPLRSTRRGARDGRRGYTLAELMLVTFVAGVVMMFSVTPLMRARDRQAVRAARQQISATVAAARAAALQRGRTGRFTVRGDTVTALVDTAGPGMPVSGTFVVLAPHALDTEFGVRVTLRTSADAVIAYDARGLANPRLSGRIARLIVTKGTAKDSVCFSTLGQILRNGCLP